MTASRVLLFGGLVACGPQEMDTGMNMPAGAMLPACSPALVDQNGVLIEGGADIAGARLCIAHNTDDKAAPTGALLAAPTLTLDGFTPLGDAVKLQLGQPLGKRGLDLTLPMAIGAWGSSGLASATARARLVVLSRFGNSAVHITPVENITAAPPPGLSTGGQLRFHLPGHGITPLAPAGSLGDVAVFEVAIANPIENSGKRHFSYRAIGGVSMGGVGASMNFFRNTDRYDAVGVMGADPGPDLTYTQGFIRDFFFGGFCPADGSNKACPPSRAPLPGQDELTGNFEAMPIQTGQGIGLTLKRSLYLRANRDLVRALGNWAYYNPADPYLPPGVPASTLAQVPAVACANPTVFPGKLRDPSAKPFYDGRYNAEGKYDVITFCDGGEVDGQPGVYDDTKTQLDPAQILLAVDLNGNGRRDKGEPVLIQQAEPYRDVGRDGLASKDEPGYDPITNPDPAGDDYHYLKNPGGTEGNWRYDDGEPYDDFGLDGVRGAGCDSSSKQPSCFDYGEGNGKFDMSPGLQRWLDHDPHTQAEKLSAATLAQRDIYYDAGIRDFFNAQVSTSALFGVLAARGRPLRLFGGFPALVGRGPTEESSYDASSVSVDELGSAVFVRYGNPEITNAVAEMTGDGRHAGSVTEVVARAVTLFTFLLSRWPDADRTIQSADDPRLIPKAPSFTMSNGRNVPYTIILPPGYFEPANANLHYPVVYVGHGYGMDPESLSDIGSLIHGFMSDPDDTHRLAKAVLVFVDAKCRPGGEVPSAPLPSDGDLCEEGAFYTDHATGTYLGEKMLDELDAYLRSMYRLHEPADVTLPI